MEKDSEQHSLNAEDLNSLVNSVNGILWEADAETLKFTYVSPQSEQILGYSPEDWVGDPDFWKEHIHPDDRERAVTYCHQKTLAGENHTFEYRMLDIDGEIVWLRDFVTVTFEMNIPDTLKGLMIDITEQKQLENKLRNTEQKLRDIVEYSTNMFYRHDAEHVLTYVSPQSERFLGCSPEEAKRRWTEFVTDHPVNEKGFESTQRAIDTGERQPPFELQIKKLNGEIIWVQVNEAPIEKEGETVAIVGSLSDITDRKKYEKKLKESISRYEIVSKATSDTIWDLDVEKNEIRYNENIKRVFGYETTEVEDVEGWWRDKLHPEDRERVLEKIDNVLHSEEDRFAIEYRYRCADGSYKHVYDRSFVVNNEQGEPVRVIGTMQDITFFKKREERARKFQETISSLATDRSLPEKSLDEALAEVLKKSLQTLDLPRASVWLLKEEEMHCIASYDSGRANQIRGEILKKEKYPTYFSSLKSSRTLISPDTKRDERLGSFYESYLKPNDIRSLLDTSVLSYGATQVVVCHQSAGDILREWQPDEISFAGAITDQVAQLLANEERKAREQEIRRSLEEKETLLSEVHHRVKNNLAVVSGMIQLQAYEEENEEFENKLIDSVVRIRTMAAIHELLYQSKSFSNIALDENFEKLVSNITDTFKSGKEIEVELDLSSIHLNVNQAIPCSLILNEVVTNAFKHAFTGKKKGRIRIEVTKKNDEISIRIEDDGTGLPDDFEEHMEGSLGLKLIDTLTQQLDGRYEYSSRPSDPGALFTLHFQKAEIKGIGTAHLV